MIRFRTPPKCGTRSGYDYHVRQLKELPCFLCREAESAYWRDRRAARGDEINAKRRERAKVKKEHGIATGINWYRHLAEILEAHGEGCYLGADCYLEGAPIDYAAPRQVGQPGWEHAFHPDHVVPLSRGGEDVLENIRPAHAYCNQRKWATKAS